MGQKIGRFLYGLNAQVREKIIQGLDPWAPMGWAYGAVFWQDYGRTAHVKWWTHRNLLLLVYFPVYLAFNKMIDGLRHFYLCTQRYKVRYQSGLSCQYCDWCDYVLSWRDWYNQISTHAVTSLIWCGTCKFETFQGFVIKWIHNPARNPVSGYRSKMAVGTYELSIEYRSNETYPKRVLQDFKKVPFFLKIAYFAPLNALRAHTAWSKKTTLLQPFLGHACLQHYTWVAPPGLPQTPPHEGLQIFHPFWFNIIYL